MTDYQVFLEGKKKQHVISGFKVDEQKFIGKTFRFQSFVIARTLLHGKYAVFSGTGTGKTRMQLLWADEVSKHTNKPVLLLAPLAVSGQTIEEGVKIDVVCENLFTAISNGNFLHNEGGVYIINYDQLDNIEPYANLFGGIGLDEGSVLKNKEGATRNKLIDFFANTKYKAVFTATPSPNDPMELGSYAEFLGVMSYNEMLSMFFVHDGGETSKWRLKKHGKRVFWEWVSTWAIMFQHPRDIGFEESGFDLPPLNLIEKQIITEKRANGLLFNDVAVSATTFNQELRLTKVERLDLVADIINNSTEKFIIWVKQNEEADLMKKLIPDAIDVRGSDTIEYKEEKLLGFAKGKYRVLLTKTSIAGMGLNFQICHNQVFASIDFSFEQVYQAIRRSLRFGQLFTVNAWLVTTDTMKNVIQTFYRKQSQFEEMQKEMTMAANKNINDTKKIKMERKFEEYKTSEFTIQLGDAVQLIKNIPDESIGLSVSSPPFADLYCYSDELEDMGNSKNYKEFLIAYGFLVKELYRVMMQGRNVAVHCMDLPVQKGKEGYIGLRSFSNMIINLFEECGFIFHSEVVCWKNPVTEMQRTKALGLLHKQIKKDSTMSRVGIPDKVLIFRKDGERSNPVTHQDKDNTKPDYLSVDMWQKLASPVWFDIDYGNTLNFRSGRDDNDEKHICPLSLDIIERIVLLYSNVGDIVLTPFLGISSEVYQAVKMNRKGIGFELKKSYFDLAKNNLASLIEEKKQTSFL
jgi:DNA modification methylase